MKNSVSKEEVASFKEIYCDENRIIAGILKTQAQNYLIEPVLDVGAGNGDICYFSCPDKEVYLIDVSYLMLFELADDIQDKLIVFLRANYVDQYFQ